LYWKTGIICDAKSFLHLEPSKPTPWKILNVSVILVGTGLSANWAASDSGTKWETPIYLLLAAVAGSIFPVQACLNYELTQHVGTPYRSVQICFLGSSIVTWLAVLIETFTQKKQ
jgi:uncharacterized membrane protein YdcZ (DUF606 family)